MKTSRPYLIRAMHEWIIDCDLTPYALVDANHADVIIPREYIEDGKILLNISPGATQNLNIGNEFVLFSARFNGKAMEVSFPVEAVLAVYAKENGRGMMFKGDAIDMEEGKNNSDSEKSEQSTSDLAASKETYSKPVGLKSTNSVSHVSDPDDADPDAPGPTGGPSGSTPPKKPSLKIVK